MTLQPGAYLKKITIEQCDARWGAGLFNVNGTACYVLNKNLPDLTLKPGLVISKLTCVRYDTTTERFYCKRPGCYDNYIDVLYRRHKVYSFILERYTDAWLSRWRKAILNNEEINVKQISVKKKNILVGRQWIAVEHNDWEMVVPVSALFSVMSGNYHFFPAMMHWSEHKIRAPRSLSVYRDDAVVLAGRSLLEGKLEITSTNTQPFSRLEILIHLHPFLDPSKYHFGVKKHCLPKKKISKERDYWKQLFKIKGIPEEEIPTRVESKNIFSSCQSNKDNSNCQVCPQNLFTKVHSRIRPLCSVYLQTAVTFLSTRLTDTSRATFIQLEQVYPDVFGIQVVLQDDPPVNKYPKKTRHRCVFRGIMFVQGQQGVIHISPVTQYTTRKTVPYVGLAKKMFIGKITSCSETKLIQ